VENAFATPQLAVLATRIAFKDILAQACAEIKILRFFQILKFFSLSFFRLLFFLLQ